MITLCAVCTYVACVGETGGAGASDCVLSPFNTKGADGRRCDERKGMKNVFAVSPFVIGFLENRLYALAALFYRVTYKVVRKLGFSVCNIQLRTLSFEIPAML